MSMQYARAALASAIVEDKIYVMGGRMFDNSISNILEEYTPPLTTGQDANDHSKPTNFVLFQNYPNPFNPITTISYQIPKASDVSLAIYNINGQFIETLVNTHQDAGTYKTQWKAKDVSSGIYLYKLTAGDYTEVRKCMLLR